MPAISSSAPGKMILCGEHAVVYHQPAIALPVLQLSTRTVIVARPSAPKGEVFIDAPEAGIRNGLNDLPENDPIRRTIGLLLEKFKLKNLPTCEIKITSSLPVASGLGSSASLSISILRAVSEFLGRPLEIESLNALAYEAEKIHHGNPSGVDNTVIAYEKPVYFIRGKAPEFLHIGAPFHFIIGYTGISASTSEAVAGVRSRWERETAHYDSLFSQIGEITNKIRNYLSAGDAVSMGSLLSQNHSLLAEMGVSCKELDGLVNVALTAGALGAKLSGGGLGGNMLALVEPDQMGRVRQALLQAGAIRIYPIVLPPSKEES